MVQILTSVGVLFLAAIAAEPPGAVRASTIDVERWVAELTVSADGPPLTFGLELERNETRWTAHLVNHPERIEVPVVEWDGASLVLSMSHYRSEIRASLEDELLVGTWTKVRGKENVATVPFRARRPNEGDASGAPSVDLTGRWSVDFESDPLPAVGVFEQDGDRVTGTFLTATGDYRYLAGHVVGRSLVLSCFDGAHAFLFTAEVDGDALTGEFRSGNWWRETWTAKRDDDARAVDGFAQTVWTRGASLGDLVYPDTEGRARSLADPEFAGRAYVLQLFGSWCPNCHDEAAYLKELEEKYAGRGLSILGIAFELTGDFEEDAHQVEVFRTKYGVEYPILLGGLADKAAASRAFPAIDRLRSFPTTVFLDASGRVRKVHSGFAGPATGEEHVALRAEFERTIEELLAEPVASDEARWEYLLSREWTRRATAGDAGRERTVGFSDASGRTALISGYSMAFSVRLVADTVWIHDDAWRIDPAGVLTDPTDFGRRICPSGGTTTPLLEARGLEGEAAWRATLDLPDPIVQREALIALVRARSPHARPAALAFLGGADLELQVAGMWALRALGATGDDEALARVRTFLTDPNSRLRRETVRTLRALAPSSLDRDVLRADPDPIIRTLAE